jgi:hypothetical protein
MIVVKVPVLEGYRPWKFNDMLKKSRKWGMGNTATSHKLQAASCKLHAVRCTQYNFGWFCCFLLLTFWFWLLACGRAACGVQHISTLSY